MASGGKREGAGKKKGGENVITTRMRFDILATLKARGFDPLDKMLDCYDQAKELYEEARKGFPRESDGKIVVHHWLVNSRHNMMLEISAEIMKYVYPQRKAIELTGAGGEDVFQSFIDAVKQIKHEADNGDAIQTTAKVIE